MSKDHWGNIKKRVEVPSTDSVLLSLLSYFHVWSFMNQNFLRRFYQWKPINQGLHCLEEAWKPSGPLICFGLRERNFFNKGVYSFRKICYSELISFNSTRWRDGTLREEVVLIAAAAKAAPTLVSWGTASSCFTKGTGSRSGLKRSMKCVSTSPAAKAWWFANVLRNPILVGKPEIW